MPWWNPFEKLPRPDEENPINEMPHTEGGIVKVVFEPSVRCFHKWRGIPANEWNERVYGRRISLVSEGFPHTEHRHAYHCQKCGGEIVVAVIK